MSLTLATDARGADLHGLGNLLFRCSFSRGLKTTNMLLMVGRTFKLQGVQEVVNIAIMYRTKWHRAAINKRVLGVDTVLLLYASLWRRSDRISHTATPRGAKPFHINDSSAWKRIWQVMRSHAEDQTISNLGALGGRLLSRLLCLLGLLGSSENQIKIIVRRETLVSVAAVWMCPALSESRFEVFS